MMVQAGHRIGVLSSDPRIHFAMHSASSTQGFVVVPLPMRDPPERILQAVRDAGVHVLMADPPNGALAQAVREGRPTLLVNEQAEIVSSLDGTLSPPGDEPDLRCLVRTSGTSGTPTWVPITGAQLKAHRKASMERLACDANSTWLASLPMWHIGGVALLDRCLHGGGNMVVPDEPSLDHIIRGLEGHPITHVSLVPTMLHRLLEKGITSPSSLQCVLIGGDALSPSLARRAIEAGWPIYGSYGLTEACSQVATATTDELREHPGTSGRPLGGVRVRIVDGGADVAEGEIGEIEVSGATTGGRTIATGDLGRVVDGRLFVTGRVDDRIISGAENVDVAGVERTIAAFGGVDEVALIGIPDDEWGQRVVAAYAGTATPAALHEAARDALAPHERPKRWIKVDALPRTGSGKLQRSTLRERARAE